MTRKSNYTQLAAIEANSLTLSDIRAKKSFSPSQSPFSLDSQQTLKHTPLQSLTGNLRPATLYRPLFLCCWALLFYGPPL